MGFFKEVMSENSREDTLKEQQKGIDLYRPYDKPTILLGGTEMGLKNCIMARASLSFFV
jgi:hypothetical protein